MSELFREDRRRTGVPGTGEQPDERRLIEASQNGDQKAFSLLIRMHQQRLFRMVFGLVGSFDMAEDIVQESWVKAWQNIKSFRTEFAFYPWLSTIARNLAYTQVSREEKKESLDKLSETGFEPVSADLSPLDQLISKQGQQRFYTALMAMPSSYRAVFVLRHFEEMDYVQIAHFLKIPPGTVDSRLYRARRYLLDALKDMLDSSGKE